jgi:aryl-alcohol dehydrogenase-like predicted oxidoreductase
MKERGNRAAVVVATKLGSPMGEGRQGLSKAYMVQAVEDSLRRLQTDYIDLYQAHRDDQETPLEETMAAFDELVKQGKVRWIGASNFTAARLAEANRVAEQGGWARYESIQPPYHLLQRADYEAELEPLCRRDEIGVITYSSLASGFLTGKYRKDHDLPKSGRAGGVQQRYMNEKGWAVLEAVEGVAARLGATPAQVALAWIANRPGITGPIASATTTEQLAELVGGIELELDEEAIRTLDTASA